MGELVALTEVKRKRTPTLAPAGMPAGTVKVMVESMNGWREGYVAAVQWHPEFHDPADPATIDDTPMLMDFLDACRQAKAAQRARA